MEVVNSLQPFCATIAEDKYLTGPELFHAPHERLWFPPATAAGVGTNSQQNITPQFLDLYNNFWRRFTPRATVAEHLLLR
jgi:hypothetical protein